MEVNTYSENASPSQRGGYQGTSWGEAILGGLPHLLTGLAAWLVVYLHREMTSQP
ncbi:MAG: hypothetical protein MUO64_05330 [Anaerolineales bacterium]|nr:hypothetical protein [Anaerolineales bacterium]